MNYTLILSVATNKKTITCPECRKDHKIGKKKEKEFPQNKYILSFIGRNYVQQATTPPHIAHVPFCVIHKEVATHFCSDQKCMKLLCHVCASNEHKRHQVAPIDVESKRYRRSFLDEIRKTQENIEQNNTTFKKLQEDLKVKTEENMKALHDRQKALIKKVNEVFTGMKEDINKSIVPYQKQLDDIANKMKSKDLIKKIGDEMINAPDWLVLQIMMEKEKELNDIIDAINNDVKGREELSIKEFDEEGKNNLTWILGKFDQLIEGYFLKRLKGKVTAQKKVIDVPALQRVTVTNQKSLQRTIIGRI